MTIKGQEDSIRERLLRGEPPAAIARALQLDYDGDEDAVVLPGWVADDGNHSVEFPDAATGGDAAQAYVDGGDWDLDDDDGQTTCWIEIAAWRNGLRLDAEGDIECVYCHEESHSVEIPPEEPDCRDDHEHDWRAPYELLGGLKENPGCWSHGAGVQYTEVCLHCGLYRDTDTWAQDPGSGIQGLRSETYRDPDDASLAWVDAQSTTEAEASSR